MTNPLVPAHRAWRRADWIEDERSLQVAADRPYQLKGLPQLLILGREASLLVLGKHGPGCRHGSLPTRKGEEPL